MSLNERIEATLVALIHAIKQNLLRKIGSDL